MAIGGNIYLEAEVFWTLDSISENQISADSDENTCILASLRI